MRLFDNMDSGNGYKVRLLLHQLGRSFELIDLDIFSGASRTPEFLAMNPNGRVPLLELAPGDYLPESNAILWYLAEGSPFLPHDALERARVLQWMFFEQYSHEPNIATSRYLLRHTPDSAERLAQLEQRRPRGLAALGVMEQHLATRPFFVGGTYTVADIALFAYTHVSHQGGFPLDDFPHIRAWIGRVEAQPNHVPITWQP